MEGFEINVFTVRTPDGMKDYISCLSHEVVFKRGLIAEAIMGVLRTPQKQEGRLTPDNFAQNRAFVDFMHGVIARHAPIMSALVDEARRQGEGWVYVIDQRTPTPGGDVPSRDIVGAFEVRGGRVVPGSYQPFPEHVIFSRDGFVRLPPDLQNCLLEELLARMGPLPN